MPQHNRLVLNFPGFETTSAVHQVERLTAGGAKTSTLWNFDLNSGEIEDTCHHKTVREFKSDGPDWQAKSRYVHFSWSDIIEKYEGVPYPKSLIRHLPGYLSFFFDGSVTKYRKTSGRYWGFTVYPILLMILFAALSFGAVFTLSLFVGMHWVLQGIIALALFLILCKFPGDRFYVNLSINDWAFARDMCNSSNPEITSRFETFADQVIKEISAKKYDEILVVGHSFGSVWATSALAIALTKEPGLLSGKRVTFLALGSSLLKIGLVKKAQFLRDYITKLLSCKNLVWHEIQTKTDFISFYKSDPFTPMKIASPECEVVVHRVNFKNALSKARHRKMKKSMYLAHRQYILYCDARVHHDFQLRVFGPFFADRLARDITLAVEGSAVPKQESA